MNWLNGWASPTSNVKNWALRGLAQRMSGSGPGRYCANCGIGGLRNGSVENEGLGPGQKMRPWEQLGLSRARWYRIGRPAVNEAETSPSTAVFLKAEETPVSGRERKG